MTIMNNGSLVGNQNAIPVFDNYISAKVVAGNDTTDLPDGICNALYAGGAGDIKVDMFDGSTVTFKAVPAGSLLPILVKRVYATGTTGLDLIALY